MEYNVCKTCGADNGRAGNLINGECQNCYKTRKTGEVCVHAWLSRTDEEIEKTMAILENKRMNNQRFKKYEDRETLERIKRWPQLTERFPFVRIYSDEWKAYWRNTGQGYTENPNESAIWPCEEAFRRTCHCGPEKKIQFVTID